MVKAKKNSPWFFKSRAWFFNLDCALEFETRIQNL